MNSAVTNAGNKRRGYRIPEAAEYMGVSPRFVELKIRTGELPALRLCRSLHGVAGIHGCVSRFAEKGSNDGENMSYSRDAIFKKFGSLVRFSRPRHRSSGDNRSCRSTA